MSNHVLQVSDVSKIYKIYEKPSDRLLEIFTRKPRHTFVTSLKNVSINLPQGQSLGVIGQNGAGKSTFLKLLANTLSPTSGDIKIHGSVAALLELGAGFNPEFSGRQNIYLNATLLGMPDTLIRKMEPEIIQFAELEDYIDRPIKTYSSGMYVRLGFAIATAANPDVLIIDEALSVGDANFQKKCIERILDFKNRGASIIFCSHNLHQLQEICDQAIWIDHGKVQIVGDPNSAINAYLNFLDRKNTEFDSADPSTEALQTSVPSKTESRDLLLRIEEIQITDTLGQRLQTVDSLADVRIAVSIRNRGPVPTRFHLGILIKKPDGTTISTSSTKLSELEPLIISESVKVVFDIRSLPLNFGSYPIEVLVGDETGLVIYEHAHGGSIIVQSGRAEYGPVSLDGAWSAEDTSDAVKQA